MSPSQGQSFRAVLKYDVSVINTVLHLLNALLGDSFDYQSTAELLGV